MKLITTLEFRPQVQINLFSEDPIENLDLKNPFFSSHLITYIGNKRRLLPFLYKGFLKVRQRLGKEKLVILDGFVGSGATARLLKVFASELHVNDLEDYSETLNSAYLTNRSEVNQIELKKYIDWLNENKFKNTSKVCGFIEKNYAPKNDQKIKPGERVFYTRNNAKIIDNVRRLIEYKIPEKYKSLCLASLLVRASVQTNTSGVFKGFHKKNGTGHFGGRGENALMRIKQEITLDVPIFSDFECPVTVHKRDINELVRDNGLPIFDLVYYDPPYNQHPYGSNYFMLNIINNGKDCEIQDGVSGIAKNWNKSAYNKRRVAEEAMDKLIADTRAHFIVISYNNEGIIPIENFRKILSKYGSTELMEQDYNTYRGSRNLCNRNIKVKEMLWILEKDSFYSK
jgi:adenine-specific DNA-methyltransferase